MRREKVRRDDLFSMYVKFDSPESDQAILNRLNTLFEQAQYVELERLMKTHQDIEQALINEVCRVPMDQQRWDWLIGYMLLPEIEDFELASTLLRLAYSYHPGEDFYFALALYWSDWGDRAITKADISTAEKIIVNGSENVSALMCLSLAKSFPHLKRQYLERLIMKCPSAITGYLLLGEHVYKRDSASGRLIIAQGVNQIQNLHLHKISVREGFNPETWREEVTAELLGFNLGKETLQAYKRKYRIHYGDGKEGIT